MGVTSIYLLPVYIHHVCLSIYPSPLPLSFLSIYQSILSTNHLSIISIHRYLSCLASPQSRTATLRILQPNIPVVPGIMGVVVEPGPRSGRRIYPPSLGPGGPTKSHRAEPRRRQDSSAWPTSQGCCEVDGTEGGERKTPPLPSPFPLPARTSSPRSAASAGSAALRPRLAKPPPAPPPLAPHAPRA